MKIFFFEIDESGLLKAGYSVDGRRHISLIWSQAGKSFVKTGAAITHDLKRHNFTDAQEAALNSFLASDARTVDYTGGI